MTASGMWPLPPRRAIAARPTASPSWYRATAFRRPAAARSPGVSAAAAAFRSQYLSAHPGRAVAPASSATRVQAGGAGLFPATGAAASGRPRGARDSGVPDAVQRPFGWSPEPGSIQRRPWSWAPAQQRTAATAAHCAASGAPSVLAKEIGPPDHLAGRVPKSTNAKGCYESARRQNHHHLTAFETRVLLDLRDFRDVALDLVQELGADFLMRHFAGAIAQGDLDLVALFEEPLHRAHLHVVVVIVDHRPQLDLLDLHDLLFLAGFGGFFLRRIFELPVVHDLANGRIGVGRNLHKVHTRFEGNLYRGCGFDRAVVGAVLIDQLNLCVADFIIGARPVFGGSGRGSVGTANG